MNNSVYIITTATTMIFLIGFLFVRAANKPLAEMQFAYELNNKSEDFKDTLSIYSTDSISIEYIKQTGDESITEWTIDGEFKSQSDAFEYTFKEAGTYIVKASNPRSIASEFVIIVETPEDALLTLEGGPHHRIGQFCIIKDETAEVSKRQWYVNGELLRDESDVLKFKPSDTGTQKIKVINRLENGKLAVAEIAFEVENLAAKKPRAGGGGNSAGNSKGMPTQRVTNLGFPVDIDNAQLAIEGSKDGKKLLEATLTTSTQINLTSFAIKGKNNSGKIKISIMDSKNEVLETQMEDCKRQNLYFTLGIDLKSNEVYKIWIELEGGAEIAYVKNQNNENFKPYVGFDILFEKNYIWMFDIEVYTP